MIKLKINLPPITKKNNQRICYKKEGKPFIMPSKEFEEYQKECSWFIKESQKKMIDYPVNVKCLFYRDSKRRCDLTNLLEAIDDVLVKYGVLADDNFNIIASHDGSRVFVDKSNPRTEIEIEVINNESET